MLLEWVIVSQKPYGMGSHMDRLWSSGDWCKSRNQNGSMHHSACRSSHIQLNIYIRTCACLCYRNESEVYIYFFGGGGGGEGVQNNAWFTLL